MKAFLNSRIAARLLLIGCLVVLPCLYLGHQTFWDPKINFLPVSFNAQWALHPVQEIRSPGNPVSRDAVFRVEFNRNTIGAAPQLVCRAFREMTVRLNGVVLYQSQPHDNWKIPVTLDMAVALKPDRNVIEIRVHNGSSVPALIVESPQVLRTGGEWTVSLGPDFDEFHKVVAPASDGPPQPLDSAVHEDPGPFYTNGSILRPAVVRVWVVLNGVLGLGLLPLLWKREPAAAEILVSGVTKGVLPGLILGTALLLHLYNAFHYPISRDPFDTDGHLGYVKYVSQTWRAPYAKQGWEMYQPPLYYYCAAFVYSIAGGDRHPDAAVKAIQLFGAVIAWGLQLITWLCIRELFPGKSWMQCMGLVFSAFVPMTLYTSPFISNESFAATVIALGLYALIVVSKKASVGALGSTASGFLVGLGLLSKYTALLLFLSGALFLSLRILAQNNRRGWKVLGSYIGAVLLISGWFYARNIAEYRNPFIGNWSRPTGFEYHQNPGYRTAGFYLLFGKVFFHHPERAPWISWADGNYASMWGDVYRAFLSASHPNVYFWVTVQALLALLPSLAILFGFFVAVRSVWFEPADNTDLLLVAFSVWLGLSLVSFTLQLPFGSTIKAFFALSALPVLAIYLIRGRNIFNAKSRWLSVLLDLDLLALACLSIFLYRYSAS